MWPCCYRSWQGRRSDRPGGADSAPALKGAARHLVAEAMGALHGAHRLVAPPGSQEINGGGDLST